MFFFTHFFLIFGDGKIKEEEEGLIVIRGLYTLCSSCYFTYSCLFFFWEWIFFCFWGKKVRNVVHFCRCILHRWIFLKPVIFSFFLKRLFEFFLEIFFYSFECIWHPLWCFRKCGNCVYTLITIIGNRKKKKKIGVKLLCLLTHFFSKRKRAIHTLVFTKLVFIH